MSAKMSKETFQRFTLLYFIGQFPEGIYSSFRLQKVLYYATRDVDPKPFTFHHTQFGQYSWEASATLDLMLEDGIIQRKDLPGERTGAHWLPGKMLDQEAVSLAYEQAFPQLAEAIGESIDEYGYMGQRELDTRAHADPVLTDNPRGEILHPETPDDTVETLFSEEQSEDIEIVLAPRLLSILKRFTEVMENTDFDDSKVRVVNSLV